MSLLVSVRNCFGVPRADSVNTTKSRRRSQSRRLLVESLERREVFSTDLISAIGIGNDTSNTTSAAVAADASGNSYLLGRFSGTVDFDVAASHPGDTDILTARGTADGYLAKYAPDNSLLWVRSMGGDIIDDSSSVGPSDAPFDLKVDSMGNAYVVGNFWGAADFGTTTLVSAGCQDGFVTKINSSGAFQWAKRWGGAEINSGQAVDVDTSGNVYVGGRRTTSSHLGSDIIKLSPNGATVWSKYIPTKPGFGDFDLAANPSGGVIVVGDFTGTVDFDPGTKSKSASTGRTDRYSGYVMSLDTSGNFKWVDTFQGTAGSSSGSGTSYSRASDVILDASGNIIVAGSFSGSVDFRSDSGTAILTSQSGTFVSKLNSSGGFVWAKALGSGAGGSLAAGTSTTWGLAVDTAGSIYLAGYFKGTVDFDPSSNTALGSATGQNFDAFVVNLSSTGNLNWVETFGGEDKEILRSISVDAAGSIHLAGEFTGTVDFDPTEGQYTLSTSGALTKSFLARWRRS